MWARTSERNRFMARLFAFIAFAMSMLPIGTRDVMAVSITPSAVMIAIVEPAPAAIAHVDTAKAPGNFFARFADVAPAATIMHARRIAAVHRGPRSRNRRTEPTTTICAR